MQHYLASDPAHRKAYDVRNAPVVGVERYPVKLGEPLKQMRFKRAEVLLRTRIACYRSAKPRDKLDRLRARTQVLLLSPAQKERRKANTLFHIQRANAFRRVDFVSRNADKIAVKRHFEKALNRVDMYEGRGVLLFNKLVQTLYVRCEARFVVYCHTAYENGFFVNRVGKRCGKVVVILRRQPYHLKAERFELVQHARNRRVLYRRGNNPLSRPLVCVAGAEKRRVVALGSARGEVDFPVKRSAARNRRAASERGKQRFLRQRKHLSRGYPKLVERACVSKPPAHCIANRLYRSLAGLCGRGVVQINHTYTPRHSYLYNIIAYFL